MYRFSHEFVKTETHHISMTQHKKCSYCDVKFRVDNTNQFGQNGQPVLRVPTYHDCSCFSRDAIKILKLVGDSRRLVADCRKLCYISRFCRDKSVGDGLVGICKRAFRATYSKSTNYPSVASLILCKIYLLFKNIKFQINCWLDISVKQNDLSHELHSQNSLRA